MRFISTGRTGNYWVWSGDTYLGEVWKEKDSWWSARSADGAVTAASSYPTRRDAAWWLTTPQAQRRQS